MAYESVTTLPTLTTKGDANDNYAQVTLALWDDYQQNFAPYQMEMLDNLTTENPSIVAEGVGEAQELVGKSFDVARDNQKVTMSRFGMAPTGQTQAAIERKSDLSEAASMADAANTTRANLRQRDMDLMTTGVPNVAGRSYGMSD